MAADRYFLFMMVNSLLSHLITCLVTSTGSAIVYTDFHHFSFNFPHAFLSLK